MKDIQSIVAAFSAQLALLIDAETTRLAREQVAAVLGGATLGRIDVASGPSSKKRRPTQFCPVPYCRGLAAPIFGMVCAKHKGVSKAKIRRYRKALRKKK